MNHILYECGICSCYHPWEWDGDCREDENRFATVEDYLERNPGIDDLDVEVRSMEDRVEADEGGEC